MKKHRVLLLIHKFVQGGAEQQIFEVARGINKNKFEVVVGSLVSGGAKWEEFKALPDVEVVCFQRRHRFDPFVLVRLISFLREKPVDIIHAYLAPATFWGIVAGLFTRTPILIIGERGTEAVFSTFGSRVYYFLENVMARFTDLVIANSLAGKAWKVKRGVAPGRVIVLHNGLNPDRLKVKMVRDKAEFGIRENDPILGNVARLVPMKDHLTLLQALELVRPDYPALKCLLIGDGPLRGDLEKYVSQRQLDENVSFLGHRNHVADFIRLFDVAVLSSKHTEGCSNFIMEAMYCGKPVVATDVGGCRELVVHGTTGFIVSKQDPQELAAAIRKLLSSEPLRKEFGSAGRKRVEDEFMADRMIEKTEEVYDRLVLHKLGKIRNQRIGTVTSS